MYRVCHPIAYVFNHSGNGMTENVKAARCTEIFAALTSSDGYYACREEIGSDPVVGSILCLSELVWLSPPRNLQCF